MTRGAHERPRRERKLNSPRVSPILRRFLPLTAAPVGLNMSLVTLPFQANPTTKRTSHELTCTQSTGGLLSPSPVAMDQRALPGMDHAADGSRGGPTHSTPAAPVIGPDIDRAISTTSALSGQETRMATAGHRAMARREACECTPQSVSDASASDARPATPARNRAASRARPSTQEMSSSRSKAPTLRCVLKRRRHPQCPRRSTAAAYALRARASHAACSQGTRRWPLSPMAAASRRFNGRRHQPCIFGIGIEASLDHYSDVSQLARCPPRVRWVILARIRARKNVVRARTGAQGQITHQPAHAATSSPSYEHERLRSPPLVFP